jgi:hypothetical protein
VLRQGGGPPRDPNLPRPPLLPCRAATAAAAAALLLLLLLLLTQLLFLPSEHASLASQLTGDYNLKKCGGGAPASGNMSR